MQTAPLAFYAEMTRVGWQCEDYKVASMFDTSSDSFFVHINCYMWSFGIEYAPSDDKKLNPLNLDKLVFESLIRVNRHSFIPLLQIHHS
jgi:hypothetical protein